MPAAAGNHAQHRGDSHGRADPRRGELLPRLHDLAAIQVGPAAREYPRASLVQPSRDQAGQAEFRERRIGDAFDRGRHIAGAARVGPFDARISDAAPQRMPAQEGDAVRRVRFYLRDVFQVRDPDPGMQRCLAGDRHLTAQPGDKPGRARYELRGRDRGQEAIREMSLHLRVVRRGPAGLAGGGKPADDPAQLTERVTLLLRVSDKQLEGGPALQAMVARDRGLRVVQRGELPRRAAALRLKLEKAQAGTIG